MLPTRYQALMTPVTRIVATLAMPSVEKRSVAVRATASASQSWPAAVSSSASGMSAPTHAAAAMRCKTSAAGWTIRLDALAADGMAGEGQSADESRGQNRRHRLAAKAMSRPLPKESERTGRRARRPPQSATASHCRIRFATARSTARLASETARRLPLIDFGGEDEPEHARQQRYCKTDPRHPGETGANGESAARIVFARRGMPVRRCRQ